MRLFRRKQQPKATINLPPPPSRADAYERGCPICKADGVESKCAPLANPFVWRGITFMDSNGMTHQHNSESIQRFECERGHSWAEIWDSTCFSCGDPQPDPEIYDERVRWL